LVSWRKAWFLLRLTLGGTTAALSGLTGRGLIQFEQKHGKHSDHRVTVQKNNTMSSEPKTWESYEQVTTYLLNQIASEFGLERFEGKQTVVGDRSGTEWEIDAKGVGENDEIFLIVECRRYTKSRQNQEKVGSLAYRIIDTGAEGGILVSPLGLQEGAAKIARSENIYSVTLDEDSTRTEYVLRFLEKLRVGVHLQSEVSFGVSLSAGVIRSDGTIEKYEELKAQEGKAA
jgi:hypothetical protein